MLVVPPVRMAQHKLGDAAESTVLGYPAVQPRMTFESLRRDIAYAIRGLKNKPGFTIAVVATLALGIGANAAMFGIMDRLLFRPPPLLKDPETAHRVYYWSTFRGNEAAGHVGRYARWRDADTMTTSFAATAGTRVGDLAVGVGDQAREMVVGAVGAAFFGFFDAPPAIGRYFTAAEDTPPEGGSVVVLSHSFWQTQYGGRADAVGSTLRIGPVLYTVIGVAPEGFVGLWPDRPPAAFIPITRYGSAQNCTSASTTWDRTYSCGWMQMIARRKPGVSIETANADLTQAFRKSYAKLRIEQSGASPIELHKPRGTIGSILPGRAPFPNATTKVAKWVAGVSVIVLLIACANVANLLLARALRRRREIALRLALGVSRARLVSQLLVESVLLAILGGAAGAVVAHWGGAILRATLLETQSQASLGLRDPRTVLFALGVAVAVGVLTGLAPVLQAGSANLTADLKAGVREGHAKSHTRTMLLVFQSALSVMLLVGAGLFVRSLNGVNGLRLGYDVDPILLVNLNMRGETMDSARNVQLRERLLQAALAMPEVANATRQTGVPFWSNSSTNLYVQGIDTVSRLGQFDYSAVSPSYFSAFGTRIKRGRGIESTDLATSQRVMVVSENMGRVLWPGRDPIGQCVKVQADTMPCTTVVGVAENIREQGLLTDSAFFYYMPITQFRMGSGGIFVRTRGNDAEASKEAVRRALQREMPGASYVTVTPFKDIVSPQMRSWRLGATMFVAFGALALVLAAVGLYSVIAYNVQQRTHEMGVRIALGAQSGDVAGLVVGGGLRVAGVGIAIGIALALWSARWVKPLLYDVSPTEPAIYVVVALTLLSVAALASWVPARRATRVDPNVALRSD